MNGTALKTIALLGLAGLLNTAVALGGPTPKSGGSEGQTGVGSQVDEELQQCRADQADIEAEISDLQALIDQVQGHIDAIESALGRATNRRAFHALMTMLNSRLAFMKQLQAEMDDLDAELAEAQACIERRERDAGLQPQNGEDTGT